VLAFLGSASWGTELDEKGGEGDNQHVTMLVPVLGAGTMQR
jgi:hypothetical protein